MIFTRVGVRVCEIGVVSMKKKMATIEENKKLTVIKEPLYDYMSYYDLLLHTIYTISKYSQHKKDNEVY